jgi:hypothetical protein
VNHAPAIAPIADQNVDPGTLLSLAIPTSDSDLPPQTLTCALLQAPAGANVDANGLFTWTPSQAQAATTNPIVVTVTDNGMPALSATQYFNVIVTVGTPCDGLKGDVLPRPSGNGSLTAQDWVQIGRFAAGLLDPENACEAAKADCAPRPCGNGRITIQDWVQAGRYAAGLDAFVSMADCPPLPVAPLVQAKGLKKSPDPAGRTLIVSNIVVAHGQTNCLQLLLDAHGDEIALGFSLSFDTNVLTFVSMNAGSETYNSWIQNTNQNTNGFLGLILAIGQDDSGTDIPFTPGLHVLANICFRAADGIGQLSTPVTFVDKPPGPVDIEIDDANLNVLPVDFQEGTVTVPGGISFATIAPAEGGQVRLLISGTAGDVFQLQGSTNLVDWVKVTDLTNVTGTLEYFTPASTNRFYRTIAPSP